MQRRPSHPHGQLTGMIVLVSLLLSIGIMFWVPGRPIQAPVFAAAPPTPPLAITRTPRAEQGPAANMPVGEAATPTMDWGSVPTPIPAEQLLAEALAATAAAVPAPAPQVVYVERPIYIEQAAPTVDVQAAPTVDLPLLTLSNSPVDESASDAYQQRRLDAINAGDAYRPRTR